MQKDIKKHADLREKVWQGLSSVDNVVDICASSLSYFPKNVVDFVLYLRYQIDVTHYWNLKDFLPLMSDNIEYILMIRM